MSLNCLACHYPRTSSLRGGFDAPMNKDAEHSCMFGMRHQQVDRSWSGNLVPRPATGNNGRNATMSNLGPQRAEGGVPQRRHSGPVECETPRLVRSCGMRRDWSFEDLRQHKVKA